MSTPVIRASVRCLRSLRRTLRLASVPARRAGGCGGGGDQPPRPPPRHFALGAGSLALALLAADHIYNEKRFFKAAQLGNVEEIRRQIEAFGDGRTPEGEGVADVRHALGWTALMAAAANDRAAAVRELLRLGARPDLQVRAGGRAARAGLDGAHGRRRQRPRRRRARAAAPGRAARPAGEGGRTCGTRWAGRRSWPPPPTTAPPPCASCCAWARGPTCR
ncbi:uncharacterized protein LOC135073457 [Ostrinia nubilalis]|uniref:uncharacterized protein LOC135073457 n=1 Tax=Ostrinia nubilalis TaxID=29057 RepID=UPI0030823B3E